LGLANCGSFVGCSYQDQLIQTIDDSTGGTPASIPLDPDTTNVEFFILIKGDTPSDTNDYTLVVDFP